MDQVTARGLVEPVLRLAGPQPDALAAGVHTGTCRLTVDAGGVR